jgi:DNA-binding LytR/AlgR family response regulator
MNKVSAYFNRPASPDTKPWLVVIVASLLVCFLLAFFQPFGIERFSATIKCYVVTGFTLVTAIAVSIVGYLFPFLFKKFYNPSTWTIGKSLVNNVILIVLIASGNFFFDRSISHRQTETFGFVLLSYILATLLIGFIPAVVSFFIVQNDVLKRNLHDAKAMNNQLAERLQNTVQLHHTDVNRIVLSGSTKESVTLYPDNILYIESSGNYVKINYLRDNVVKQKQLRTTIAQMDKELELYPYIIRCHRAYMINTSFINHVEGNSQGFQLRLRHVREEVPVSRSYLKVIRNKL